MTDKMQLLITYSKPFFWVIRWVMTIKKIYIFASGSNRYPNLFLIHSGLFKTQKYTGINSLYKNSLCKTASWSESEIKWSFI